MTPTVISPATPLLDHLLVVDRLPLALGMTGRILADLGATVVRVPAQEQDAIDWWHPAWRAGSQAWAVDTLTVDPSDGRAEELLDTADIVLEPSDDGAPP